MEGEYTEACQCYTSVIDYNIYPIRVLFLQKGSEIRNTLRLRDIKPMVFNRR